MHRNYVFYGISNEEIICSLSKRKRVMKILQMILKAEIYFYTDLEARVKTKLNDNGVPKSRY